MNVTALIAILLFGITQSFCCAQAAMEINPNEADIQFSRIMRHKDGSTSRFLRTPNNEVLEKKTYMPGASTHCMRTVYRLDRRGNIRGCQIYDGLDRMLFKSRYGYDPETGRLHEEQMFDARVKNLAADGKTEMPVRRFIYTFDANGKQNKPISIVLKPGRKADEIYAQPSGLEKNPFDAPAER